MCSVVSRDWGRSCHSRSPYDVAAVWTIDALVAINNPFGIYLGSVSMLHSNQHSICWASNTTSVQVSSCRDSGNMSAITTNSYSMGYFFTQRKGCTAHHTFPPHHMGETLYYNYRQERRGGGGGGGGGGWRSKKRRAEGYMRRLVHM